MRALGLLGMLLAAVVVILMVKVGQSVSNVDGGSKAQTGSQKAYQDLKRDGDMDDPKEEMRDALKGGG